MRIVSERSRRDLARIKRQEMAQREKDLIAETVREARTGEVGHDPR